MTWYAALIGFPLWFWLSWWFGSPPRKEAAERRAESVANAVQDAYTLGYRNGWQGREQKALAALTRDAEYERYAAEKAAMQ